jgi:ABC-type glycerol-3-phosphate transport system substrate-binding protein
MGLFVDLDTLKPMLPNNWYDDNILPATQEHLKIDGVLYGIPNWARKDASGGNVAWMVTTDIYNAAGAPTIMTYEDLYAYAINVRDNVPTTAEGLSVIPVIAEDGGWMPGSDIVRAIYRSLGAPFLGAGNMWSRVGSTYQFLYRDPLYREAILETNKWFNEGLLLPTHFTDSREQFLEKLTTARGGLIWYDHSQDDGNNFRRTVRTNYPGNSIELVTMDVGGRTYLYPPARGLSHDKIYGEHYGTVGWNVTCITTAARHPERIFELVSYWLTKEGSIEMMYGPQGGFFWSELNSDGNPILHVNPDDHPEEVDRYALWHYTLAGHADNVDHTKFAANDMLPADNRSWVVSAQAHIFTPLMRPLTDEFHAIGEAIEPDTPLHVQRTIVEDHVRATLAQIVMASSADAAERMIDEAIAFVDANGGLDIERVYNERYQENLAKQGGTIFNR